MKYLYISLGCAVLVFMCVAIWLVSNNLIKNTRFTLKIEGAGAFRIVHLSDLHGKLFGKNNIKLIKRVALLKPDVIVFTGDIIHIYNAKNISAALKTASALKEIAPVLYVAGNHEMRNKGYRNLRKELKEAGVTVLDDECILLKGITFVGLNGASLKNAKIEKITPDVSPKILLAHEPQYFEKYSSYGYSLVLCGHAHGGQWRIPFTKQGLYAPGQGIFPKYTQGLHVKNDTSMIISRGLGNSEFPLRLFNRPEIVVVDVNA